MWGVGVCGGGGVRAPNEYACTSVRHVRVTAVLLLLPSLLSLPAVVVHLVFFFFFTLRSIHIIVVVAETRQSALRPERERQCRKYMNTRQLEERLVVPSSGYFED